MLYTILDPLFHTSIYPCVSFQTMQIEDYAVWMFSLLGSAILIFRTVRKLTSSAIFFFFHFNSFMVAIIRVGLGSFIKRKLYGHLTELCFYPGIRRRKLEHYRVRIERECAGGKTQGLILILQQWSPISFWSWVIANAFIRKP